MGDPLLLFSTTGNMMTLGQKLTATIQQAQDEENRKIQEERAKNDRKRQAERQSRERFVQDTKATIVAEIETGKQPRIKVKNYDLRQWIEALRRSKTHTTIADSDIWEALISWLADEGMELLIHDEHDGIGMSEWITLVPTPKPQFS